MVRRGHSADRPTDNKKTEIYYIAPNGKKLKNINEIRPYLQEGLDLAMFTFDREPIGGGLGPTEEIIRTTRGSGYGPRRANFLDLGEPDPTLGFGKRIIKPKMPKGASPPPPATQKQKVIFRTIFFEPFCNIKCSLCRQLHRWPLNEQNPMLNRNQLLKHRKRQKPSEF